MTQPTQPTAASDHARHDPALIAALADREPGLEARDLARARELVVRCEGCRDLLADLVIIRDAIPASMTPARPRAFTLAAADAERLRSTGWRRLVGFFGSARDGFSRPLAVGFTTIGIVALVVTASPFSFGASSAAPVLSTVGNAVPAAGAGGAAPQPAATAAAAQAPASAEVTDLYASAAASAAASYAPAANQAPSAAPSASSDYGRNTVAGPVASGGESGRVFTGSNDTDNDTSDADEQEASKSTGAVAGIGAGPSLGIIVGGLCLIVGFGLFALRWTSRRLAGG